MTRPASSTTSAAQIDALQRSRRKAAASKATKRNCVWSIRDAVTGVEILKAAEVQSVGNAPANNGHDPQESPVAAAQRAENPAPGGSHRNQERNARHQILSRRVEGGVAEQLDSNTVDVDGHAAYHHVQRGQGVAQERSA